MLKNNEVKGKRQQITKGNKLAKKQRDYIKRNIKDSVFTSIFREKKYSLALYKAINPNDKDVKESDIENITLTTVFTEGLYNDLGILVKNKVIFLLEAQSTWSENILFRYLSYLGDTYKKYFDNRKFDLYTSKKVTAPIPELYVLYTGGKKIKDKTISLNKAFFEGKAPIDIKVKVITDERKKNILKEYILFTKLSDKIKNDKYGNKPKRLYKECIRRKILKEYILSHREEFMSTMKWLFDQEYVTKIHEDSLKKDAFDEGMQQGMQQGMVSAIVKLIKEKLISVADGAKQLGMSESELKAYI